MTDPGERIYLEQKERVLIVDDDASLRMILKLILQREGHSVVGEAKNGHEGLRALGLCKPSLMVLDLDMPSVEGLSVLRKVRRLYPQLPVLVVSSLGSATYAQRCKRLGARGFLGKEDCVAFLCQAIRRLRRGNMFYPQEQAQNGMLWGDLSDRELIALRCLARGADVETISDALEISSSTAKLLCQFLQAKLGLSSSEELVGLGRYMRLG